MDREHVFEISELSYGYAGSDAALTSIDMVIDRGESVAILGANGSGKSTLLKIMDGLYYPHHGQMKAFDAVIDEAAMRNKKFAMRFHARVGLVFQDPDVQLFLPTVWDEVAFAPLQLGMSKSAVKETAADCLERLGIYKLKDRAPYHLSGGEKKKVAIASVLSLNPEVWLMDEPIASLDPRTRGWMIDFILELVEDGKTVVTATHDMEIPKITAESCYVLGEEHKIITSGTPDAVLKEQDILIEANLIHKHRHYHGRSIHSHGHSHAADHEHNTPQSK